MKKVISYFLLSFMLISIFTAPIVSANEIVGGNDSFSYSDEYMETITLDDGTKITADIEEETEIPTISTKDFSAKEKVGTKKTYKFRVTNYALGLPNILQGGLTAMQKKKAVKLAAKLITKKLGANFIPGVNFISWALVAISFHNSSKGNKGFEFGVKLEYTRTYLHREGYALYGWSPVSIYMKGYK